MTASTCNHGGTAPSPWADVQRELRRPASDLRRLIPGVFEGFAEMHAAAMAPGELDGKTKELMALALAVGAQCDGCIASHAWACARLGATEREVAEALGVVVLMTGGPGTVYGPRALSAFREFAEDLRRVAAGMPIPAPAAGAL